MNVPTPHFLTQAYLEFPERYFLPYHQGEDDIMQFLLYTPAAPPESKNLKNPPIGAGAYSPKPVEPTAKAKTAESTPCTK
jgi:hypothetical protein